MGSRGVGNKHVCLSVAEPAINLLVLFSFRYADSYVPLIPEPLEDVSYKTKYTDIDRPETDGEAEAGVAAVDIEDVLEAARKTQEVKEEDEEHLPPPIRIEVEQVKKEISIRRLVRAELGNDVDGLISGLVSRRLHFSR